MAKDFLWSHVADRAECSQAPCSPLPCSNADHEEQLARARTNGFCLALSDFFAHHFLLALVSQM